ncbi:unnamed protein product [Kluyveromyces dobzhanskii CBS 2104]|uniref:Type 1 phosphatases regulator n=1 Tax=Kluyveromyces dobzhanskii CBS 2104 TaxID=1427455 RepID=A0A0A8L1B4_9SACH|nr:unnamed protein product [Kluyveromyces dobzhanskii CBS 2104]
MSEGPSAFPADGTQTVTVSDVPHLLQLRTDQTQEEKSKKKKGPKSKVRWDEKVVDNEHMNKKKTKICCIFHPNTPLDSDEEEGCEHNDHEPGHDSSSSSSSSSSDDDEGKSFDERRKARLERRREKIEKRRPPSPNAYEVQPDYSAYRDKSKKK